MTVEFRADDQSFYGGYGSYTHADRTVFEARLFTKDLPPGIDTTPFHPTIETTSNEYEIGVNIEPQPDRIIVSQLWQKGQTTPASFTLRHLQFPKEGLKVAVFDTPSGQRTLKRYAGRLIPK